MKRIIFIFLSILFLYHICFTNQFFLDAPKEFALYPLISQKTELIVSNNEICFKNTDILMKTMYFKYHDDYYFSMCDSSSSLIKYSYSEEKNILMLNNEFGMSIYVDFANLIYCLEKCDAETFKNIISIGDVKVEI